MLTDAFALQDNLYAKEVTLQDMYDLHVHTGLKHSLHVSISEAPRFINRFNLLSEHPRMLAGVDGLEDDREDGAGAAEEVEADAVDDIVAPTQEEDDNENAGDQTFLTVGEGDDDQEQEEQEHSGDEHGEPSFFSAGKH